MTRIKIERAKNNKIGQTVRKREFKIRPVNENPNINKLKKKKNFFAHTLIGNRPFESSLSNRIIKIQVTN